MASVTLTAVNGKYTIDESIMQMIFHLPYEVQEESNSSIKLLFSIDNETDLNEESTLLTSKIESDTVTLHQIENSLEMLFRVHPPKKFATLQQIAFAENTK